MTTTTDQTTLDFSEDPRVLAAANCLWWAVIHLKNQVMFDQKTRKMSTLHAWFSEVAADLGHPIPDAVLKAAKEAKK
jgi:hypothetical protein